MYVPRYILFLSVLLIPLFLHNANAQVQLDPASVYYNDNGNYVPYKLVNNANSANIYVKDASLVFDKNQCNLSIVNKTGSIIGTDSYSVLASFGNSGVWNPVSIINNAACNPVISENDGTITVTGTKAVTGAGIFQINYTKAPLQKLKTTFSATNQNPSWTNYHIGMAETIELQSKYVTLGNQTYDLSQYNNTVLSRAWITSHHSQLIRLSNSVVFDMGIGWNHANDITIHWINNKASITIDYTYNTPILSPGQTITVDPALDTSATCNTDAATTCNITIGSNSNRLLIVELSSAGPAHYDATAVKIGATSFTHLNKKRAGGSGTDTLTDIWYLTQNAGLGTGAKTVTITWTGTPQQSNIGLLSLYNVNPTTPISNTTLTTGGGATTNPITLNITPTTTGSWIVAVATDQGEAMTSPNHTSLYSITSTPNGLFSVSQYYSSPTIGAANTFSWASTPSSVFGYSMIDYEVLPTPTLAAPTLTHANTLNSTAIKLDWSAVTGASGYVINMTSPYGGTFSQIVNQTGTSYTKIGLSGGTQYVFKVAAWNGTGTGTFSGIKSNYTTNIAPTSPVASLITNSQARISVTNPSGNFSGYLVYKVSGTGSNYTLAGTSSNTTNHFDLTGLSSNREYTAKFATRYAVGSNYSGVSTNSTTVSFYTLPNSPTSLTALQTAILTARLSWTAPTDNGTVSGYKVEQSLDNVSWTVLSANTGNTTTSYTKVEPSTGTYYFRVSTIKYGGTSAPSNTASVLLIDNFVFTAYHADNSTAVYGQVIQANSTSSNNRTPLVGGVATLQGISGLNNFTVWNSLINFIVGKNYNYNATAHNALTMATNDYNVDCPYTGTGDDIELWTNGTNGHRITAFTTPVCYSNGTVKWKTDFKSNGNSATSYSTEVYVKILNATYLANAPLKYNSTVVSTALSDPYVVSAPVTVGTATTSAVKTFYWSMNLTISPLYLPVNFTVGHLSVSGTNPVTAPITFSSTAVNSTATAVTVTFPSTYTMGYQLTFGNEGTTTTLTGLPVTSPSLGLGQSTITFLNPSNDLVTIRAYDIPSNTTARYILAQPNNQIPFVAQILAFKNGTFGTSAMIGGIDIVSLIILIVAMIGLNRVNETVGAVMMIIIIGVCGYFGIIEWPTIMTSAIALVLLVIVTTTKKLPWS